MKRLPPRSIEPSATNGDVLKTTGGVAVWGAAPSAGTAASVTFTPTGNLSSTNVQDALAELDTEKAAAGGTGGAPATTYRGIWASGTTYVANDTAEDHAILWQANSPVTGTAPTDVAADAYTGGPTSIKTASGFANCATQKWTFGAGGTFPKIRSAWYQSGGGRVGFSSTKPTGPNAVTWLAYADVTSPAADTYVTSTLNTPLVVTAGQIVWAVALGNTSSGFIDNAVVGSPTVGDVTLDVAGGPFYANAKTATTWSGPLANYALSIQLVTPGVAPWKKIADLGFAGAFTTAARPAANSVRVGVQYFDTTLNKPAWSDGTAWRDATGTAV